MRRLRVALAMTALLASLGLAHAPTAGATIPPTICDGFAGTNPGVSANGTNSMTFSVGVVATCTGPTVGSRVITVAGSFVGTTFSGQWNDLTGGCRQDITGTAAGVTFSGTMTGTCGTGAFLFVWAGTGPLHGDMT